MSWNVRRRSDRTLFPWWDRYRERFKRVGLGDITDRGTTYVWGPEASTDTPKSPVWVAVVERRA